MQAVQQGGSLEVPAKLRNASTGLMKNLGYGDAYRYAHDEPESIAWGEHYLPSELLGQRYYEPTNNGLERAISEKLQRIRAEQEKTLPRKTSRNSPHKAVP